MSYRSVRKAVIAAAALLGTPAGATAYQGFGASTNGGAAGSVVVVTTLNDSGTGSLRAALTGGNRTVVFAVGGTIDLATELTIRNAFVTIDGLSAPAPGITLRGQGLTIRGPGGHDVIVRGLRIRDAARDGIWVTDGAYNIVIDHCSIHGSRDGNIDITRAGTRDVTVSWSVLSEPAGEEKNMLIAFQSTRVTLHHNVFIAANQRNPQVTFDDSDARREDTQTTLDMRNNLIWNWHGGYGTRIRYGAAANVVNNYYASAGRDGQDTLIVCRGSTQDSECYDDATNVARAFVDGNVSADGWDVDGEGTGAAPFPAAPVTMDGALAAACATLAGAGVRPLDALDQSYLATVDLGACLPPPPPGNTRPVARAGADRAGTAGLELVFDAAASSDADGDPLTFAWDFGDGGRADGVHVSHVYAAAGVYTVRLTVSDGRATATDTLIATIVADDAGVPGSGSPGTFVETFAGPDDDALDAQWSVVRGSLMVVDGQARNEPDGGEHLAVATVLVGARQSAAADFSSVRNSGMRMGVALRYQDPLNYYAVYRRGGTSRLVVAKVVDGVETVLAWVAIGNPKLNTWFRLAGRAEGTTVSLDLDGVEALSVSDATFTTGRVGFLVHAKRNDSHRIDNFTATIE